jgi:hypothetical protein
MSSQDLVLRSSPSSTSSALSPLGLGLSAVLGYNSSYNSGYTNFSFASDLLSRLLFMLFERLFRSLEALATRYVDRLADARSETIRARLEAKHGGREGLGTEVKVDERQESRPQVLEAVAVMNALPAPQTEGLSSNEGASAPACPLEGKRGRFGHGHSQHHEPPPIAKRMMERRERWRNWMFSKTEGELWAYHVKYAANWTKTDEVCSLGRINTLLDRSKLPYFFV